MAKKFKKKAQEGSGASAAVIIGVITVLIIFYIVFLPPEDRADLLGDGTTSSDSSAQEDIVLYEEPIGKLAYVGQNYYDHTIPNMYLFESTDTNIIKEFSPFTLTNGWFTKTIKTLEFALFDLQTTDSFRLAFDTQNRKGILRITLNDDIIYESAINTPTISPISINKDLLRDKNRLVFEVSGVRFEFWKTNQYALTNVKILADKTDKTRQQGQNIVVLTKGEKDNAESAYIQFDTACKQDQVGPLEIVFNNRVAYSSVPDCYTLSRVNLNLEDLSEGMNTIKFSTTKGQYRVEQAKIRVNQKETKAFVDYFTIEKEDYDKLDDRKAFLTLTFVDDSEDKTAQVNINGHYRYIDQKEPEYEADVTKMLEKGNNYIRIEPKTALDIVEAKIYIE